MEETDSNNLSIMLPDGRRLGYSDIGYKNGNPVFFFHGTPGSRFVLSDADALAQIPGMRFILPERPGYGLSDPKPDRTLVDWSRDVEFLANQLGIDTFAIIGVSGGGPHALACGYGIPKRTKVICLLSSPSPAGFKGALKGMAFGNKLAIVLNRWFPGIVERSIHSFVESFHTNPEKILDSITSQMTTSDRHMMNDEEVRKAIFSDLSEAYRQGGNGHLMDSRLSMTSMSWGFDLKEVSIPVHLWHGELDTLVPKPMAIHLSKTLPNCKLRSISNAGHLLTEDKRVIAEITDILVTTFANQKNEGFLT